MSKQDLRAEALTFQELLNSTLVDQASNNGDKYSKISTVIQFIENTIEPFKHNQQTYDDPIFVMGPTGVGKSTLISYIAGKELFFKTHNNKPGIFPDENDAIAYVGKGEGSTTIAPNIWRANTQEFQNVTFIDCAGECDSGGSLIEIINSKIKTILAQNITRAKILIIASQDSIGPSGSYGVTFREGLESSAQFLSDITHFQDSMAFIVSHAGRVPSTQKTIESYLNTAKDNPKLAKFKTALENIINNNNIATFSKYSDESEEGSLYSPPQWNLNQRSNIIKIINKIDYQQIPQGFFNDSSSLEVREQMSEAFEIVKAKAVHLLKCTFDNAFSSKLQIYAASLKSFVEFIEQSLIENTSKSDLLSYIKYVNDSHFFSLNLTNEMVKVNDELKFLGPFTKFQPAGAQLKLDWNGYLKTSILFKDILNEAKVVIFGGEDIFSNFSEQNKLITKGYFRDISKQLKNFSTRLYQAYKDKAAIESARTNDKYYFYQTEKQFKGMKQESYTEQQPYTASEPYTKKNVPYQDTENYTHYEFQREERWVNHLSYDEDLESVRNSLPKPNTWTAKAISNAILGAQTYEFTRYVPVTKTRSLIKYKDETKYKDVIKYQTVTKYKDIPEYQDVQVRKFNEKKYNDDINDANKNIDDLRNQISDCLKEIRSVNAGKKASFSLDNAAKVEEQTKLECSKAETKYDSFKVLFSDLNEQWKYLEYEARAIEELELTGNIIDL